MKRKKHTAPQFELPFPGEAWRLVGEVAATPAPATKHLAPQFELPITADKPGSYADRNAPEFKVTKVKDCAWPAGAPMDSPEAVANFWRRHVQAAAWFRSEQEALVVLHMSVRCNPIGFHLSALGTFDSCLASTIEIFRTAIMRAAPAVVLMHNHPSGDPSPSEADIAMTRNLIRAGELLKIQVLDHVIIGTPREAGAKGFSSLRELGYFYTSH